MTDIAASCRNDFGDSRSYVIVDSGRDPNSPPGLLDGYLDPDQFTGPFGLYSADGIYGNVTYQRSGRSRTVVDSITDGSAIAMA